jgi:type II secretory ATPase GspE/PulE/Tfp pilus assembly ATPase PilB-like protein
LFECVFKKKKKKKKEKKKKDAENATAEGQSAYNFRKSEKCVHCFRESARGRTID